MSEQFYLLKISAMHTCDDCDVVPSAEVVVDRDFGTADLPLFEALQALTRNLAKALEGAPVDNLRPMTRAEIQEYRDAEKEGRDVVNLI